MTDPLKIGLIGCGGIVQRSHWPALLQLGAYAEVSALADPVEGNREIVGASAGVPAARRHADYRDMLAAGGLDFALVATPHHLHTGQAIAVAEAGLGIISEKPMATSLEEADAVLASVKKNGVPYAVVHNYLFNPGSLRALELMAALEKPQTGRAKSLFLKADDQADPASVWRASRAAGGGCIGDTCYHEIYMLEALMQSPVRYVEARVQTRFFPIDVDDVALLLLEHENGAVSTVSTSWGMPGGGAGELANLCEVHARDGSLRLVGRGTALHAFSRQTRAWSEEEIAPTDSPSGHAGYLEETLKALHAGQEPPITGVHARHNLSIIEAARAASDLRRAVDLHDLRVNTMYCN
jgi:predicted dehydrogenase